MSSTPEEISPYSLIQEEIWKSRVDNWPWRILVMCKLMNLTTALKARQVMKELFERWPTPRTMEIADRTSLSELLRPLGLQNRRANALVMMSADYVANMLLHQGRYEHIDVDQLYGVGKYASDSWRLFVKRQLIMDVQDKELKNYVEWARRRDHESGNSGVYYSSKRTLEEGTREG